MATRTRNLKLIVDDNLSASAKFNLSKLDSLGSVFQLDNTTDAVVRSIQDIILRPRDSSVGGDGVGGTVTAGSVSQPLSSFAIHADAITIDAPLGLFDSGTGGTKNLVLAYDSTISGLVDTAADRTLSFDLNGANRSLVLGGNFSLLSNSLSLTLPTAVAWTLPSTPGTNGQVLTNNGSEVLSWSTVVGAGTYSANFDWVNADGVSKTITHSQNTRNMIVQVLDSDDNYATVDVRVTRPTLNTVVLESSEAPANSWRVLLYATN